jgi:Sec-independent protein translocase protein TatA
MNTPVLAIFNLGWPEFCIVGGLIMIFWGGKKLPGLARGFAQFIPEMKKGAKEPIKGKDEEV